MRRATTRVMITRREIERCSLAERVVITTVIARSFGEKEGPAEAGQVASLA